MKQLISAVGDAVLGVASGFDRIVFHGMIRPLMYPEGAMGFFRRRRIAFKDAKQWVTEQTEELNSAVEKWSLRECGERITYLPSATVRKEAVARKRQQEKGITTGVVGTWSCVEAGGTYRLVPGEGAPQLRYFNGRCKHLYIYMDHPEYGFMSIRTQTWLPYKIQIALNGREWLVRQLERAGVGFGRLGNKILFVEDFRTMQELLDQQLATTWWSLLDTFVPIAFPTMTSTLGDDLSELNVLRIESTINDPRAFRVHRRKQGADEDENAKLLPLRKGVADMTRRARICQGINDRFADHVATTRSSVPLYSVLASVTQRRRRDGRSIRALEPTGKDLDILKAVADPRFVVGGFCNKDLRRALATTPRYLGKTDRQQSGITTRALRLLRDHGLIRRLPRARRYQLTADGRLLVTCLQAALAASTEQLAAIAA